MEVVEAEGEVSAKSPQAKFVTIKRAQKMGGGRIKSTQEGGHHSLDGHLAFILLYTML